MDYLSSWIIEEKIAKLNKKIEILEKKIENMTEILECVFCEIVKRRRKSFIVGENEHALAVLSTNPISEGHVQIITKEHLTNITLIENKKTWESVLELLKTIIFKIQKKLKAESFNILSNIGSLAYQTIFHAHIHIIPKYSKEKGLKLDMEQSDDIPPLEKTHKKLDSENWFSRLSFW